MKTSVLPQHDLLYCSRCSQNVAETRCQQCTTIVCPRCDRQPDQMILCRECVEKENRQIRWARHQKVSGSASIFDYIIAFVLPFLVAMVLPLLFGWLISLIKIYFSFGKSSLLEDFFAGLVRNATNNRVGQALDETFALGIVLGGITGGAVIASWQSWNLPFTILVTGGLSVIIAIGSRRTYLK